MQQVGPVVKQTLSNALADVAQPAAAPAVRLHAAKLAEALIPHVELDEATATACLQALGAALELPEVVARLTPRIVRHLSEPERAARHLLALAARAHAAGWDGSLRAIVSTLVTEDLATGAIEARWMARLAEASLSGAEPPLGADLIGAWVDRRGGKDEWLASLLDRAPSVRRAFVIHRRAQAWRVLYRHPLEPLWLDLVAHRGPPSDAEPDPRPEEFHDLEDAANGLREAIANARSEAERRELEGWMGRMGCVMEDG